jgi:hypothetical protein
MGNKFATFVETSKKHPIISSIFGILTFIVAVQAIFGIPTVLDLWKKYQARQEAYDEWKFAEGEWCGLEDEKLEVKMAAGKGRATYSHGRISTPYRTIEAVHKTSQGRLATTSAGDTLQLLDFENGTWNFQPLDRNHLRAGPVGGDWQVWDRCATGAH